MLPSPNFFACGKKLKYIKLLISEAIYDFFVLGHLNMLYDHFGHSVADPGFLRGGGANSPGGGRQHTILPYFPKNCMKLKEFGPLDPPLALTWIGHQLSKLNIPPCITCLLYLWYKNHLPKTSERMWLGYKLPGNYAIQNQFLFKNTTQNFELTYLCLVLSSVVQ